MIISIVQTVHNKHEYTGEHYKVSKKAATAFQVLIKIVLYNTSLLN